MQSPEVMWENEGKILLTKMETEIGTGNVSQEKVPNSKSVCGPRVCPSRRLGFCRGPLVPLVMVTYIFTSDDRFVAAKRNPDRGYEKR